MDHRSGAGLVVVSGKWGGGGVVNKLGKNLSLPRAPRGEADKEVSKLNM